jgi:hypothetical protein
VIPGGVASRVAGIGGLAACLLCAAAGAEAPRFADAAGALPIAHVYAGGWEHFVGGGVAAFDCDGDGLPELAAAGGAAPARLFRNRSAPGRIAFAEGAFPALTGVTGLWPLDIDGDGHLDLAVLRVGANVLLRGLGDCRFEAADWGFMPGEAWSTAFSASWEAGAAFPTLAVGNYVDRGRPDGPFFACDANELHRPGPLGYGPPLRLEPGFCALSVLFSDWARTGRAELRISNDRHYYVRGGWEQMWRLDTLTERVAAGDWPRISLWGMGIASRDLTGDGLPEVFLTSMADQLLQFNIGTGFENAPYAIGTYAQVPHAGDDGRPTTGWHAEFGDIDNDGRPDLFIAKGNVDQMPSNAIHDPNNLLMQNPDGTFREASVAAGVATMERARGAALVDLDGDGLLDIVVVNRRAPMEVWHNVTPAAGAWVQVEPRMAGPNTRAVGAWVEVRAEGRVQAQEVTVGGGHGGGQAGPLHFGLGAARGAAVRVIWPGGAVSDWAPLPLRRRVTLRPDGAALAME